VTRVVVHWDLSAGQLGFCAQAAGRTLRSGCGGLAAQADAETYLGRRAVTGSLASRRRRPTHSAQSLAWRCCVFQHHTEYSMSTAHHAHHDRFEYRHVARSSKTVARETPRSTVRGSLHFSAYGDAPSWLDTEPGCLCRVYRYQRRDHKRVEHGLV
jgi:hypothetical protein